jgi:hypothetical protein
VSPKFLAQFLNLSILFKNQNKTSENLLKDFTQSAKISNNSIF